MRIFIVTIFYLHFLQIIYKNLTWSLSWSSSVLPINPGPIMPIAMVVLDR